MGGCTNKSNAKSPQEVEKLDNLQAKSNISPGDISDHPENGRKNARQKDSDLQLKLISNFDPEAVNAMQLSRQKTSQEIKALAKLLSSHFLFASLPDHSINQLISNFKLFSLKAQEIVFEQNSKGQNFYIIQSGKVEVIVNGQRKKIIEKMTQFGELALLHDSLRTATIKTVENALFWVLNRKSFQEAVHEISRKNHEENNQFIDQISVFQVLTKAQKEDLVNLLVIQEFEDGQKIFSEGEPGNMLYVIKKGCVVCSKNEQEIRKLWPGDYFGEQALIYNTERTATVTTVGPTILLSLGRKELMDSLGNKLQYIIYKNTQRIAIEKHNLLKYLFKTQVDNFIEKMRIMNFETGMTAIEKDPSIEPAIYIIVKGQLKCGNMSLNVYDCIGLEEEGELIVYKISNNWIANEESHIAVITKSEIEIALSCSIEKRISLNKILSILKKIQLLRLLPQSKLELLTNSLKIKEYSNGEIIFRQNDLGDSFYIVKQGQVEIQKDGVTVRVVSKNDYFGERSIIKKENRTATVISHGPSVCWWLSKNEFLMMIDENIQNQLTIRMHLQNDKIQLNELLIVKLLGKGMFGQVFLVYHSSTNFLYALKTVSKQKTELYEVHENLILERKVLLNIDHPMIIKLVKTFKDQQRVYFLMEYVQGIDLFDALREMNILTTEKAKFYVGCLLLILEHLHEREIIYRDLKPENIMVDFQGYLKLIDFGTAKMIKNRTYTMIGTPHYMAPEIIKGTGYSFPADYWSVGVLLYEFVCGFVPFGEEIEDPVKIYKKILENKIGYPSYVKSQSAKMLIEKLLDINPAKRGPVDKLKNNPWFIGLSWEALLAKQIKAHFIPKVENHSKNIQKVIKSSKKIIETIETMEDKIPENKKAPKKVYSANWDEEF